MHRGQRSSAILCVAWLSASGRGKEVTLLDGACPCLVSATGANDSHSEDDNRVYHHCQV